MKIVVLLKQVPDTWGERRMLADTGRIDRGLGEQVIDEVSERALEVALTYRDSVRDTEVVALGMGPAGLTESLRKALAMGADSAVHVRDDRLVGADAVRTAEVLAAALRETGFDLVLAGNMSTDGRGGVVPAMIAERLQVPCLSSLDEAAVDADGVLGTRSTEGERMRVRAGLPAIASITERGPEPRFPGFKGIIGAKRKPIVELSLADLAPVEAGAASRVIDVGARPPRSAGRVVTDDGTGVQQLVEYLAAEHLI